MTPGATRPGVAFLTNLYPATTHSFIRREIAALEAAGWDVHRFAHRRAPGPLVDPADIAEAARTCVLVELPRRQAVRALLARPLRSLAGLAAAWRMAREGDGRLLAHLGQLGLAALLVQRLEALGRPHLHVHFGTNPATVARLAQRLAGTRYSLTVHGPHEFVEPDRLNLGEKIAGAEFVAAVSRTGLQRLRERHPGQAHKLRLVPCGLDEPWWSAPAAPTTAPRLLAVARLEPQKDPLRLVDAAAQLAASGEVFQLAIAGDGSLRGEVEARIARHALHGCVQLLGWRSGPQVAALLDGVRALVLSSQDEGLPVAVMEAFARGRPAIAPDVGGMRELLETGATGWCVPAGDTSALAEAMRQALQADAATLAALGDAARRRVAPHRAATSATMLGRAFQAVGPASPPAPLHRWRTSSKRRRKPG